MISPASSPGGRCSPPEPVCRTWGCALQRQVFLTLKGAENSGRDVWPENRHADFRLQIANVATGKLCCWPRCSQSKGLPLHSIGPQLALAGGANA